MVFTELYELIILKRGSLEPKTVDLKSGMLPLIPTRGLKINFF